MLERHPLSAAWGDMSEAEYAKMVQNVREHGVIDPVIKTMADQVLDGWYRYRAARDAGKEGLIMSEYTGPDPVDFVISRNRHRRHLTAGQIASCVVKCEEWRERGRNWEPLVGATQGYSADSAEWVESERITPARTAQQVADDYGLSVRNVEAAKTIERAGLGPAFRGNDINQSEALRQAHGLSDAPKPPTHTERLEADRDALKAEVYEKAILIEELEERVRFLEGEAKDTPHEREAIFNRQQAQISALTSQVNELTTKHEDERLRANYFKREAKSRGWKPQQQERLIDATVQRRAH